ncbi:platelet binding protein GspB isoform X2 [Octopus sinensis]|nr:platelet binding protein GspB isoform X2 [Octopus sinensis]
MSCNSSSLGEISGEKPSTATLQAISVPHSTADGSIGTEGISWSLDAILPAVHGTEEKNPFLEHLHQFDQVLSCDDVKEALQQTRVPSLGLDGSGAMSAVVYAIDDGRSNVDTNLILFSQHQSNIGIADGDLGYGEEAGNKPNNDSPAAAVGSVNSNSNNNNDDSHSATNKVELFADDQSMNLQHLDALSGHTSPEINQIYDPCISSSRDDFRGLASVAVTDHAYAIPANREPRDPSYPLMSSKSVQTPFEQSDYEQLCISNQEEEDASTNLSDVAAVQSSPVKENDIDDDTNNKPKRRQPQQQQKKSSPVVTPTNIRRSTRISEAEQREMAEKIRQENRQKEKEAQEAMKKQSEEVSRVEQQQSEVAEVLGDAEASSVVVTKPDAVMDLVQPLITSTPVKSDQLNTSLDTITTSTSNTTSTPTAATAITTGITSIITTTATTTTATITDTTAATRGRSRTPRNKAKILNKDTPVGVGRVAVAKGGSAKGKTTAVAGRGRARGKAVGSSTSRKKKGDSTTVDNESNGEVIDDSVTDLASDSEKDMSVVSKAESTSNSEQANKSVCETASRPVRKRMKKVIRDIPLQKEVSKKSGKASVKGKNNTGKNSVKGKKNIGKKTVSTPTNRSVNIAESSESSDDTSLNLSSIVSASADLLSVSGQISENSMLLSQTNSSADGSLQSPASSALCNLLQPPDKDGAQTVSDLSDSFPLAKLQKGMSPISKTGSSVDKLEPTASEKSTVPKTPRGSRRPAISQTKSKKKKEVQKADDSEIILKGLSVSQQEETAKEDDEKDGETAKENIDDSKDANVSGKEPTEESDKGIPLMKSGRPKRQARIRKEEREKAAKASELEEREKKKLKRKRKLPVKDVNSSVEVDKTTENEEEDEEEEEEEEDEEEVPLFRLKKMQNSADVKAASSEVPVTPAKKLTKKEKKAAALQAKAEQEELARLEEEKARLAAEEKARAEQKARAEKEAKKRRKQRKSEESLDKTMIDLFKPDGVIVHESSKKENETDIQADAVSQTLPEKSSVSTATPSSLQSSNSAAKTVSFSSSELQSKVSTTGNKTAIAPSKPVHSSPSHHKPSVVSYSVNSSQTDSEKMSSDNGKDIPSSIDDKTAPSSSMDSVASMTVDVADKFVSVNFDHTEEPVRAETSLDEPAPEKQIRSKADSVQSASTETQSATSVKMEAETTMSNDAFTEDIDNKSLAVSIGCQADEDSEYEYVSCTEEMEDDRHLQPRLQGKTCTICNMVQDNQYLVDCDICRKSFHGHCAELTLEDMQRILQDGEKFVCDNCPLEGTTLPVTTEPAKEESTTSEAAVPVQVDASVSDKSTAVVKSKEDNSESTKKTKNKKSVSSEPNVSKAASKESVNNSDVTTTPKKLLTSSAKKEKLTAASNEATHKKEALTHITTPVTTSKPTSVSSTKSAPVSTAKSTPTSTTKSTPVSTTKTTTVPTAKTTPVPTTKTPAVPAAKITPVSTTKPTTKTTPVSTTKTPVSSTVTTPVATTKTTSISTTDTTPISTTNTTSVSTTNTTSVSTTNTTPVSISKKAPSESKIPRKSSRDGDTEKEKQKTPVSKDNKRKLSTEHYESKDAKDRQNSKERAEVSSKERRYKDRKDYSRDKYKSSSKERDRRDSKDKDKDYANNSPSTKSFGNLTPRKPEVSSAQVSSSTGTENEKKTSPTSDSAKKKKLLHFKDMDLKKRTFQQCIGAGCKKDARTGSVYCSDECIVRHAQESLALLKNERHFQQTGQKPSEKSINPQPTPQLLPSLKKESNSKVVVLERKSGRILTGPTAPTESVLREWLTEHPTFEVLQPSQGLHKTPPFYGKDKDKRQPQPEKKISTEPKKKEPEPKQGNQVPKGPDDVRLNVKKSLHEALSNRAREANDINHHNSSIRNLVINIEEELHRLYNDSGQKYKARYRSLIFNIKDSNNKGLFRKILNKQIKPYRLVRMTADELASPELSQWRQKEVKHTLEMIEQREVEAIQDAAKCHVVKKTHKGEVDVAGEDLSTLETSIIHYQAKPVPVEKVKVDQKVDIVGDLVTDTTDCHRKHLFDLNCKICTGKIPPPSDEPLAKKAKKEALAPSTSSSPGILDKNQRKPAIPKIEKTTPKTITKVQEDTFKDDEVKTIMETIRSVTQSETTSESKASNSPRPSAMKSSSNSRNVTVRSPDSVLQSGLEKKVKFSPSSPLVWKGFIHMQDLVKFMTTAYRLSGPTEHLELQDTVHVCGRIAPELIWDYLNRIKQTGSRDICVLRFLPGTFDEKNAYVMLYSYLNSRGRCGVVGNNSRHIKDMYIVPLASHSKIPAVLLPFDEPGLEDNRPHMLLGVIVRQKVCKRPGEQLAANAGQAVMLSEAELQTKRLKYDPTLPSTTVNIPKIESSAASQPVRYDPFQPATLPKYTPSPTLQDTPADLQSSGSTSLTSGKETKYYNPVPVKEQFYTPSLVLSSSKNDRLKQPSPSPVDSSTSDSPENVSSCINDPIVKAYGKLNSDSELNSSTPTEDLSTAPYSPTQYEPTQTSFLDSHEDKISGGVGSADQDSDELDNEKPYDPEECDFDAEDDSPPPPPPPPPPPLSAAVGSNSLKNQTSSTVSTTTITTTAASTVEDLFNKIKKSTLPSSLAAASTSGQQNKPEVKDLLGEFTQRIADKKPESTAPKPAAGSLPTALQNLFSQVSRSTLSANQLQSSGSTPKATNAAANVLLPIKLAAGGNSVLSNLVTSSMSQPSGTYSNSSNSSMGLASEPVNTNNGALNLLSLTTTSSIQPTPSPLASVASSLPKDQALSSLVQSSPISVAGWSKIAETLASLAKVHSVNLPAQNKAAGLHSNSTTGSITAITPTTTTTTVNSYTSLPSTPTIDTAITTSTAIHSTTTTTATTTNNSGLTQSSFSAFSLGGNRSNLSGSQKTISQYEKFDSTSSQLINIEKKPENATSKTSETNKGASVRIAFSTGPKHPLVPHAVFKEEEKPKLTTLMSEPKIPGLGLDEEDEIVTASNQALKETAFLSRAKFETLTTLTKTDTFLSSGVKSDSFLSSGLNPDSFINKWKEVENKIESVNVSGKSENDEKVQPEPSKAAEVVLDSMKIQSSESIVDNQKNETPQYEVSNAVKSKFENNKESVKNRSSEGHQEPPARSRESHHDSKSRPSSDSSKDSRRQSDSDRKRSHYSDSSSSKSSSSRYSERSERHGYSRHSRSRDYSDKRDRDYRKDYSNTESRSRDRDYDRDRDRDRDRDYEHSSSRSRDRSRDRKDYRRSSSSKGDERSSSKKNSEKGDKFVSTASEESNRYGDVDERKKMYSTTPAYPEAGSRFSADKKDMASFHSGAKQFKDADGKSESKDYKAISFMSQDQDLRKGLSGVPNTSIPAVAQPIPTLTSNIHEEFPRDVDHRKHSLSWQGAYEPNNKDATEESNASFWSSHGDVDYRTQNSSVIAASRTAAHPPVLPSGNLAGWGSHSVPGQPTASAPSSFQPISTVLHQRSVNAKPGNLMETGNQADQDMRKQSRPGIPPKIEVILPRPTAKDFFGSVESESGDSVAQPPSLFEVDSSIHSRTSAPFKSHGNSNESLGSLHPVMSKWSTTQEKLVPPGLASPLDVDDRPNAYRTANTAVSPAGQGLPGDSLSSSQLLKVPPVDSSHTQEAVFYTTAATSHSELTPNSSGGTTTSAAPQETRPLMSVANSSSVIDPDSLSSVCKGQIPLPYCTPNPTSSHQGYAPPPPPPPQHMQPAVEISSDRLQQSVQWEGCTSTSSIALSEHSAPPPPQQQQPPPQPQAKLQQHITGRTEHEVSNNSLLKSHHQLQQTWSQVDSSKQPQLPPPPPPPPHQQPSVVSVGQYYEHASYSDVSPVTVASNISFSSTPPPPPPPLSSSSSSTPSSTTTVASGGTPGSLPPPPPPPPSQTPIIPPVGQSSVRPGLGGQYTQLRERGGGYGGESAVSGGSPSQPPPPPSSLHRGSRFLNSPPPPPPMQSAPSQPQPLQPPIPGSGGSSSSSSSSPYNMPPRTDFPTGKLPGQRGFAGGPRQGFQPPRTNFNAGPHGSVGGNGGGSNNNNNNSSSVPREEQGSGSGQYSHHRGVSRFN